MKHAEITQAALDALAAEEAGLRFILARTEGVTGQLAVTAQRAAANARLDAIAAERAALQPAEEPEPEQQVRAAILVQRSSMTVMQQLHLQLFVASSLPEDVKVTGAVVHATPVSGAILPADLVSGHAALPVVPAGGELHLPVTVSFLHAGSYSVGAHLTLSSGAIVDAKPTTITVRGIEP